MNYGLIYRTVRHLRPTQVWHQVKYRLVKPKYVAMAAPLTANRSTLTALKTEPIPRYKSLEGNRFTFLNLEHEFSTWDFTGHGMLWAYNQNYFDWINQGIMVNGEWLMVNESEGCKWIDKFIEEAVAPLTARSALPLGSSKNRSTLNSMTMDPYPIALRSINWIKFFCRYPETATKERLDALYSQVRLLEKKLEYHLLANHLLEDAFALYISGAFFGEERLLRKAKKLLLGQLKEQILPDGAHYEQSPMYHCILLDRLLDCINISSTTNYTNYTNEIKQYAVKMLGHLKSVVWSDGSIPLLNDAAYGIAPTPEEIFDYARRLDFKWEAIPMKECGYRKMRNERMEAIVDVGNITATYQPGHTHADTFNYELRIDGKPFVVDTGVSTYNKNERRQLERSTVAHNCVVVDGKDSSEVWGGFRVGRRARVSGERLAVSDDQGLAVSGERLAHGERLANDEWLAVEAVHDGYGKPCKRRFEMTENQFVVEDWFDGEAISYVHLAEGADANRLAVSGDGLIGIQTKPWQYSTEYNKFHNGIVLEIAFRGHIRLAVRG